MMTAVGRSSVTTRLALTVALLGCAGAVRGEEYTSTGQPVPKELEGLPKFWQEQMEMAAVPGLAVVVVKGDKVIYEDTFGVRDPQTGDPVTPETGFYIASCTKSYLAFALKQLEEKGVLNLSDKVKKFLPRMDLPDDEVEEKIRVRDLLSHRYGINSGPIVTLDAYTGQITEDRYYHFLAEGEVAGKQEYTNVNYTLAGRVLEAVTGRKWQDVLAEEVFAPAGMTYTTGYASELYGRDDAAQPCEDDNGTPRRSSVRKTDATMHAAGGMGTTINDVAQWLKIHTNGGVVDGTRLISEAGLADVQKEQATGLSAGGGVPGRVRTGYSLGWFTGTYRGEPIREHGGGYIGTATQISFMPNRKLGVAVFANSQSLLPFFIEAQIYDRLLETGEEPDFERYARAVKQRRERAASERPPVLPDAVEAGALPKDLSKHVGKYTHKWWGMIELREENGRLVGNLGALPMTFVAPSPNSVKVDTGMGELTAIRFREGEDGRIESILIQLRDDRPPMKFVRED